MLRERFDDDAEQTVAEYTASVGYDWLLYRQDIAGSIAHVRMLARQRIITDRDAELIVKGLTSIRDEIGRGEFQFKPELEDVHMNIEARLAEKIGDVAGKLHTARSRNDQVATDMRLFVKEAVEEAVVGLQVLQSALVGQAEANKDVVMPGYTHLQHAQPVLLAHHLLAYFEMLERDVGRFHDCFKRTDVLPLGSGALAGVSYDVDREAVARELGFNQVSCNSMDAVSDRDFVVEFQAAAAIAVMHLSRLGEELVVWSSAEFSLVEIDDAYATGSSIMPQKKNPDVAELARGKTGRVYGHLISILTTLKGLPLSYNRDLQEDKEGLFDTVYTINATFQTFAGMVKTLKINRRRCEELTGEGYLLATDFADYLVKKGIPFREAHAIVCRLVRYAEDQGKSLHQLDPEEYKQFSPLFEEDVRDITTASALVVRDVTGGTAPKQVEEAIKRAKRILEAKI